MGAIGGKFPDKISGLIGWYDAADMGTINSGGSIADATSVTAWKDKSGQANNLSGVGTYKLAIQNGLPIIRLNGTSDNFSKSSPAGYNVSDITVFVANKRTGASGTTQLFAHVFKIAFGAAWYNSTVKAHRTVEYNAGGLVVQNNDDAGAFSMNVNINAPAVNTPKAHGVRFSNSGDKMCTVKQGHAAVVTRDSITNFTNAAGTMLLLGGLPNNSFSAFDCMFTGDLYEIITYNSSLSDKDFTDVMYYLKSKWGL